MKVEIKKIKSFFLYRKNRKKTIMLFTIGFFIELFILIVIFLFYEIKKKKDLVQKWKEYDHRRLMSAETKLIEIAKWIEGEKIHRDPGRTEIEKNAFIINWISDHAEAVRTAWEISKCRICVNDCFHNMKIKCSNFARNKTIDNKFPFLKLGKSRYFMGTLFYINTFFVQLVNRLRALLPG